MRQSPIQTDCSDQMGALQNDAVQANVCMNNQCQQIGLT